jgi:hypothetical protein
MSSVRVQSIEALKGFRAALCGFADKAASALNDTDAAVQRALNWLQTEQRCYWEGQIRRRTQEVATAKQAVLVKKLCRNVDGSPGSAVEEEKALRLAIQRLEEAQQKLGNVGRCVRQLEKEILNYHGQVQRFASDVAVDVPLAVGRLDAQVRKLEDYVALRPVADMLAVQAAAGGESAVPQALPSMARPEPATRPADQATESEGEDTQNKAGQRDPGSPGP